MLDATLTFLIANKKLQVKRRTYKKLNMENSKLETYKKTVVGDYHHYVVKLPEKWPPQTNVLYFCTVLQQRTPLEMGAF